MIHRVHACILEMERCRERLLIIGHQGILRIIYAYWAGLSREEAPNVSIPLNHIVKMKPRIYDCEIERIPLLQVAQRSAPNTVAVSSSNKGTSSSASNSASERHDSGGP